MNTVLLFQHKPKVLKGQCLSPTNDTVPSIGVPHVSRSVSIYKRREYNMDSDGLQQTDVG